VAAVALSGSRQTSSAGSGIRALIEFIRAYPAILLMGAINFCITTGVLGALLWIPLIAAEIHGSTVMQVGWISAAVFSGGALGMLIVGALSDRSGRRFSFLTGCLIVAPLGYALAATTHDPTVRLVALGVGTAFMRSSAGDFFVGATERLPPDLRSSGLGILAAFGGLGGFTGPTLLGLVRERTGSFSAALLVLAGLLLIGALLGAHVARDFRHRSR
jgi:MFS family permease